MYVRRTRPRRPLRSAQWAPLCLVRLFALAYFAQRGFWSGDASQFQLLGVMRHCHATEEVISSLADDSAHVALVSPPSEDLLRENVIRRANEKVVDERTPLITHPTTPGLRGGAHTWQIRVASCERTSLPTHTHTHPHSTLLVCGRSIRSRNCEPTTS